jgi:hypothetical protein
VKKILFSLCVLLSSLVALEGFGSSSLPPTAPTKTIPKKPVAKKPIVKKPAPKSIDATNISGVYEGTMTMTRAKASDPLIVLPLVFALQMTNVQVAPDVDEPLQIKNQIDGSFLIDQEAGPFFFTKSDFEINTGRFILQYNRISTIGSPSTTTALQFECDRQGDGSCSGTVTSADNLQFATFSVKQTSNSVDALRATPKYVGMWKGTYHYNDTVFQILKTIETTLTQDENITLTLAAGDANDTPNPPKWELDSTPNRLGSWWPDNEPAALLGFTTVLVDYFHRQITMTTLAPNGYKVTLIGNYDSQQNMTGVDNMSNFGNAATFSLKKVQQ